MKIIDTPLNLTNQTLVETFHNINGNLISFDTLPEFQDWYLNDSLISNSYQENLTIDTPGDYELVLISKYKNCTDTNILNFTVHPKPNAPTVKAILPECLNDIVEFYCQDSINHKIIWKGPNEFNSENCKNLIQLSKENIGLYYANYLFENCVSDTAFINIEPENIIFLNDFNFPNIITPNKDKLNDFFEINEKIKKCTNFEICFYNRWGGMVYKQTNESLQFNGLDENEKSLSEGVYFYVLKFENLSKTGFIHLIR